MDSRRATVYLKALAMLQIGRFTANVWPQDLLLKRTPCWYSADAIALMSLSGRPIMRDSGRLLWLFSGLLLGAAGTALYVLPARQAQAAGNDRFEDYVLCTGPVGLVGRVPMDGVWLLDYRAGKLLGTMTDRAQGKLVSR